jgi:hypothetical protein
MESISRAIATASDHLTEHPETGTAAAARKPRVTAAPQPSVSALVSP